MLLLTPGQLEARRGEVRPGGALASLFDSLAGELEPVLAADLIITGDKALFSTAGIVCPHDKQQFDFDPRTPHRQQCARCGRVYQSREHHLYWLTHYQLWLAERVLQSALFASLRGDARHERFARVTLLALAERYLRFPNVDNVLGPTRPFFSTYLESIWLLQLCLAADFLKGMGDTRTVDTVIDRIVEPSRRLIYEFDERKSNRQVWNNAALMAAAQLCGDERTFVERIDGEWGLYGHIEHSLLPDGTWYEGENYHQFGVRGLWYGITMAEAAGVRIPGEILARFNEAFPATFASALPDFTMPSRKDSQYRVSLRQWRLAEMAELGFARAGDRRLLGILAQCYEPNHDRRDTGRWRSAADAERNVQSGLLTRDDLGWRGLLFAAPVLPMSQASEQRSINLKNQGFAILRRAGGVYAGFEHGQRGGSHGHYDRLNVTLYHGSRRWLDDVGTGSYADQSLKWYRSTLAHNAPIVNGKSQPKVNAVLLAYEEGEGMGWVQACLQADPVTMERSMVVAPDYLVDELRITGDARVELPIHLDGDAAGLELQPMTLDGSQADEDGFRHVTESVGCAVPAGALIRIEAVRDGRRLVAHVHSPSSATLFKACAYGPPGAPPRWFFVLRLDASGAATAPPRFIRTVVAWEDGYAVSVQDGAVTVERGNERHVHRRAEHGWHVDLFSGSARSSIDLQGREEPPSPLPPKRPPTPLRLWRTERPADWFPDLPMDGTVLRFPLGRTHYRRSEPSWREAGRPSAAVALQATKDRLVIFATINAGDRVFRPANATNPYDNDHPDTMGAGVQLHLRIGDAEGAWMLVPENAGPVRLREVSTGLPDARPAARWRTRRGGRYEVRAELMLPPEVIAGRRPFDLDVIVNETVVGRVRRRGQLLLSGANRQWVYMRGDHHENTGWVRLLLK